MNCYSTLSIAVYAQYEAIIGSIYSFTRSF